MRGSPLSRCLHFHISDLTVITIIIITLTLSLAQVTTLHWMFDTKIGVGMHLCAYFTIMFVCLSELTLLTLTAVLSDISVPKQVYLQSIHLNRLVSRLTRVKPKQSEWLFTELFSAECGSSLNSSRVASAELNVYPYIIPEQ